MTPLQIKITLYGGAALVLWLLRPRPSGTPTAPASRVTSELVIDANVDSPTFGMTPEEIAAQKGNPAVDPDMRHLIDVSNTLLAADDVEGSQQ